MVACLNAETGPLNRTKWLFLGFVLCGAILFGQTPSEASEFIVFESNNSAFQPGQALERDHHIKLARGQSATLITLDGKMIILQGPFDGSPGQLRTKAPKNVVDVLLALSEGREKSDASLGVARQYAFLKSPTKQTRASSGVRPTPWSIDPSVAGDWCYRAGDKVYLWRPTAERSDRIEITTLDQSWQGQAMWKKNGYHTAIPAATPLTDKAMLWFARGDTDILIKFHVVPKTLASWQAQAAWMAQKNCKLQAQALLQTHP